MRINALPLICPAQISTYVSPKILTAALRMHLCPKFRLIKAAQPFQKTQESAQTVDLDTREHMFLEDVVAPAHNM